MESIPPSSLAELIVELGNSDRPLLNSKLTELSNLNSEELELFKRSWSAITPIRRRQIVYRLVELAEDNLTLNFDAILKYCLKDQDEEVQSRAIEGLWENEEPSLISPLIDLLQPENTETVQVAASIALGKFAMLVEHKKIRDDYLPRIQQALLTAIQDQDRSIEVRSRALESVAPLSLPQVRMTIMNAYKSHNSRLKVSSIYAMGKNCDPSWLTILLEELVSNDTEIRFEAAEACGEIEEEEAVPHLAALIEDPDIDVQMAAIQALGKIGGSRAKECLELCLDNESEVVHQTAEQVLYDLEAKETYYISDSELFDIA